MQEADTGRSDRASSADGIEGDTRKGANTPDTFDTSEDCLSESECRVAASGGMKQSIKPSPNRRNASRTSERKDCREHCREIILTLAIIGAVGAFISHQLPKTERSY